MIIKLKKEFYNQNEDMSVTTPQGELLCKVLRLKKGYYIYNKLSEPLAQVTFDQNIARLVLAHSGGDTATLAKLARTKGGFVFLDEVFDEENVENVTKYLKKKLPNKFSLWGDTSNYAYDIYDQGKIVASVAASVSDKQSYSIDIGPRANLLFVLMIALAIEKLNFDPMSKL